MLLMHGKAKVLERSKYGQLQLIWRLVKCTKTSHDGHNTARKNRLPKRNITRCKQQIFPEDVYNTLA